MNTKQLLLLAFTLFLASSAFALQTQHFIDGERVHNGQQLETNNPFEYKINLFNNFDYNDADRIKTFTVKESISRELTMVSSNYPYDAISIGPVTIYTFQVPLERDQNRDLIMSFRNDANEPLETASINVSFFRQGHHLSEFNLFFLRLTVPAIPEFEFLAIPIVAVIGSYWVIRKNQKKM